MTVKHKCSARIPDMYGFPGIHSCARAATVEHGGKWYCWQHDPRYVAKKAAERRVAWEAEMDREAAKYRRIARDARLGALVTPELPALLERAGSITYGEKGWTSVGHFTKQDGEKCYTLAARIREALAQETNDAKGS